MITCFQHFIIVGGEMNARKAMPLLFVPGEAFPLLLYVFYLKSFHSHQSQILLIMKRGSEFHWSHCRSWQQELGDRLRDAFQRVWTRRKTAGLSPGPVRQCPRGKELARRCLGQGIWFQGRPEWKVVIWHLNTWVIWNWVIPLKPTAQFSSARNLQKLLVENHFSALISNPPTAPAFAKISFVSRVFLVTALPEDWDSKTIVNTTEKLVAAAGGKFDVWQVAAFAAGCNPWQS